MRNKIFTIKKGRHYSSPFFFLKRFLPSFKKSFHFTVEFDQACLYQLSGEDQLDINKLFGVGCNTIFHHKNSVRIGWRSTNNTDIELVSYLYVNSIRQEERILSVVKPYEKTMCQILFIDEQVIITTTDINHTKTEVLNISKKQSWGFLLWPYFGGNKPAPHTLQIDLHFKHKL